MLEDLTKALVGPSGVKITEEKPIFYEQETIKVQNTGNFLKTNIEECRMLLSFIKHPFFIKGNKRAKNIKYEFEDSGVTMFCDLPSRTVDGQIIKQPGLLEEDIFEFFLSRYFLELKEAENEAIKKEIEYILFTPKDFIEGYLGKKMTPKEYKRIENALRNLKHTTYSFIVSSTKKAKDPLYASKRFFLLDYESLTVKRKKYYKIYLDLSVKKQVEDKRFIILKTEARRKIGEADSIALRIYQFISSARYGKLFGEERVETLAAIAPLKRTKKIKKTLKDGTTKMIEVSTLKKVKDRIEDAFKVLISLGYIKNYELIIRKEDKKWNIGYEFGDKEGLISSFLDIEKKISLENNFDLSEKLKKEIEKTKHNIYFSKSYNNKTFEKIIEIVKKDGENIAIKTLRFVYVNLNNNITNSLEGYLKWAWGKVQEENGAKLPSKTILNNCIMDAEIIKEKTINNKDLKEIVNEMLIELNIDPNKYKILDEKAYKRFIIEGKLVSSDNKMKRKIYDSGKTKYQYLLKELEIVKELKELKLEEKELIILK